MLTPTSLTPEKQDALRARAAQLMTPEEHAQLLNGLRENAAEIVEIGQRLLGAKRS